MSGSTWSRHAVCRQFGIFATITLLFIGRGAFAVDFSCESMLVSLARMHAQKPRLLSLHENAGLPENNREAALAALAEPSKWLNGKVQFKSDLGLSEWTPEELKDYLAMEESLKTPASATERVLQISAHPEKPWPGVSAMLRRVIHDSHELWKAALKEIDSQRDEILKEEEERARANGGSAFVNWPLWVQGKAHQMHRAKDKISLAWGRGDAELTDGLGLEEGYEILRMVARENLIRHLIYQGLDGTRHTGMDTVLDTRLLVAERPLLVPLLPLLEIYPPKLDFTYVYGLSSHEDFGLDYHPLDLVTASWPVKYGEHTAFFVTLEPGAQALTSINVGVFNIEISDDHEGRIAQTKMKKEILTRLNSLAEEFRTFLKISKPISVEGTWEDQGLAIRVASLSRINQFLFFYYVSEALKTQTD